MAGDPKFVGSQSLPDFPYARFAQLLGLHGMRVEDPEELAGAWDTALNSDRPVVLEAVTDPDVPPLPPHVKFEQAKSLMFALTKGDVDTFGVVERAFKGKLEEFLPHRRR